MKAGVVSLFFILLLISLIGCGKTIIDCENSSIHIENRWYAENGGVDYMDVTSNDRIFICETINNFSEGENIVISHNYGYLEIFLSGKKTDMIFTYSNGVVYRVGKYVRNEELTRKILRLMFISKRCWVKDCLS
ncbi:hypothetical protein NZ698_15290 [Chryseobacterium sp. PBS4-4]|uniref:Uncharacterized protein n=1 Tax=Chryseobacterium edaphi TaxID=2976532 RepID=A0ABT2WB92_9FLAO|nr:hypothetical protein [Chryseobacterium edaphi]MCU7618557.1 hypothetical protein [Chryseobacterium edaphi]